MTKFTFPRKRAPLIALTSIPDNAWITGDFSEAFVGAASISKEIWDWLCCGSATPSAKRTDFLIKSLLQAMRDEQWNPDFPHTVNRPLFIGLLFKCDSIDIRVSVLECEKNLLYVEADNAMQN